MPTLTDIRGVSAPVTLSTTYAQVIRGRGAILSAQPLLVELARFSLQPGAADYIDYFLTQPYMGGKIPVLVLLTSAVTDPASTLDPSKVLGAVLLYEYRFARVPINVFTTEDYAGERNVLAPAAIRSDVALLAVEHLLSGGAHLVVVSLKDADFEGKIPLQRHTSKPSTYSWSTAQRMLTRRLPLSSSYDATLATLGAHTRRNLRYYRRRVEDQLQCKLVPDAQISEEHFVALNRLCSYPTPDFVSKWRYQTAHSVSGGFFAGLQSAAGDWLSIVGGRRYHRTTSIDWQMNQTRFSSLSLSTVMRSYLIEHEISEGSQTLLFEGGTPHSMQHSFPPDSVVDLIAARRTIPAQVLIHYAATILPTNNFLAQTLSHPGSGVANITKWLNWSNA